MLTQSVTDHHSWRWVLKIPANELTNVKAALFSLSSLTFLFIKMGRFDDYISLSIQNPKVLYVMHRNTITGLYKVFLLCLKYKSEEVTRTGENKRLLPLEMYIGWKLGYRENHHHRVLFIVFLQVVDVGIELS